MSDYFHCDLCDKLIKIRSNKRHLSSHNHKSLTRSIICKYTIENPSFFHINDILQNYVDDYNKKFEFFLIYCKWKLHFSDTIINIKSDRLCNIYIPSRKLRPYLISKNEFLENKGRKFCHISEMNIVFMADLRNIT